LNGDAWKGLHPALAATLLARLEKAGASGDARMISQMRALAPAVKVEPRELEPAWSRYAVTTAVAVPAQASRGDLVNVGGTAFMRTEVSRADYAAFASSTGRPTAHCRNRTAPITLKKRTWVAPGFEQTGNHPAVCISFDDATAYARWLSQKTGESYRLPTAAEWRQAAAYAGSGDPCRDGRIACGEPGTVPVNQGPSSPQGLSGMHGNAREWLSDCAGNCRQRLVSGLGWRDGRSHAEPLRSSGFDADTGFDDVGFRLVREAARH
jgi:formylglycine-generating enzyme required for sulfatase activity